MIRISNPDDSRQYVDIAVRDRITVKQPTQTQAEMNRGLEVVRQNSLFDFVGAWAVRPGEADRAIDIKQWADAGLIKAEALIDPSTGKKSVRLTVAGVSMVEAFDEFPSAAFHASVILLMEGGHVKPNGSIGNG